MSRTRTSRAQQQRIRTLTAMLGKALGALDADDVELARRILVSAYDHGGRPLNPSPPRPKATQ